MIRYLYIIQRNSINNKPIREMRATEDYIEVNNIKIDNVNRTGVKLKYDKEELVQYIGKIEQEDFKKFQTTLQSIVELKGLCCKYNYNNQQYLAIPSPRNRKGVWHEGDLIVHQVGTFNANRDGEVVLLGDVEKKTELKDFTDEQYYSLWEQNLNTLINRGENIYLAMFMSFILAYTKYYNDRAQIKPQYRVWFYHISCCRGIEELSVVKHLTPQQFNYYIEPALHANINAIQPDKSLYTPLSVKQLTKAYNYYIQNFWNWHNR